MDDPPGETSAFEDLVLSLIIIDIHRIDSKDLLKIDDLWVLLIDLYGGGPPVDGSHRESGNCRCNDNDEEKSDDHPSPLLNDSPIIPEMNLFLFLRRDISIFRGRRELVKTF
jgi:hypothetical protein